jgi:hypothetical protein
MLIHQIEAYAVKIQYRGYGVTFDGCGHIELLSIEARNQSELYYGKSLRQNRLILYEYRYLGLGCWWFVI